MSYEGKNNKKRREEIVVMSNNLQVLDQQWTVAPFWSSVVDEGSLELLEGLPINTSSQPTIKLLYPISVVSDGGDSVYVAALTSTDAEITSSSAPLPFPNWQESLKYGTSQDMTIIKVSLSQPEGGGC
jgi:hypothetical protein